MATTPLNARLVPLPRSIVPHDGTFSLDRGVELQPPPGFESPALEALRDELERRGALAPGGAPLRLVLDGRSGHPPEGYALTIDPRRVLLVASRGTGLNHGLRTLTQILRLLRPRGGDAPPPLPCAEIVDAPTFARRGVMLDVSRDRVPRMDFMLRLVERLAELKLNELQLYFEHAFAYRGHERVWEGVDPFTHDEVRELDEHCRLHGIQLVPNQQSFGHLHHWLRHDGYRHLAEVPEGIRHPFLAAGETRPEPYGLCPTDPRSLEFLAGLYDDLLPCFSSDEVNVGMDETLDLGLPGGRSAEAVKREGVGRVYLGFLRSVHRLLRQRGKRMQFWADILLQHPKLAREIPKDTLACIWGYEADHPFDRDARIVADAGLPFVVCPGTSAWQSLGGRLANMLVNVRSAAIWGLEFGAKGVLITDWGDRGHLQAPFVSGPGFVAAADAAWNPARRFTEDSGGHQLVGPGFEHAYATWAVPGTPTRDVLRLAKVPSFGTKLRVHNASPLSLLLTKFDEPFPPDELRALEPSWLETVEAQADEVERFTATTGAEEGEDVYEAELVVREVRWTAGLMRLACQLGVARLRGRPGAPLSALEGAQRRVLAERLDALVAEHRELWLERSRPGGLDRSARWLERIVEALREG